MGDDARLVIRLLDRDFLIRLLYLALLYSLVPLAEIAVIFLVGDATGRYLALAAAASTGLLGALAAAHRLGGLLAAARGRIRSGEYPEEELVEIAGVLAGALLLMTPGFITDAAGLVMLVPAARRRVGRMITRRLQRRLTEAYEVLRLYDL